ncbi:MAG: arylesterase [SAR86 cluster bacterium]|jgi:acyl-CoA thioesterase-1|nr:arylesterase [SAR86 cluster bacterium]
MLKKFLNLWRKYNFIVILLPIVLSQQTLAEGSKRLLVLGDSISAGYGVSVDRQWTHILQRKLDSSGKDLRIVNVSLPGETTGGGLSRIPSLLKFHSPDYLLIELGGNDALRGYPVDKIKFNLTEICKKAEKQNVKIILMKIRIPPNYGRNYMQAFEAIYTEVAKELNIQLVPFMLNNVALDSDLMFPDGIHPNEKAQPLIAEDIFKWAQSL